MQNALVLFSSLFKWRISCVLYPAFFFFLLIDERVSQVTQFTHLVIKVLTIKITTSFYYFTTSIFFIKVTTYFYYFFSTMTSFCSYLESAFKLFKLHNLLIYSLRIYDSIYELQPFLAIILVYVNFYLFPYFKHKERAVQK